jgi:hypothetical protein
VARDDDGNGNANDPGEVGLFIDDTNPFGVPIGLTIAGGEQGLYVTDWFDFTDGHIDSIFRLVDLNGNWTIDNSSEAVQVWTEAALPMDAVFDIGFGLAVGPNDDLMLGLNSGDTEGRSMIRLTDLNGDGDYMDPGETLTWGTALERGGFIDRARSVEFIAAAPAPSVLLLLCSGLIGVALSRRKQTASPAGTGCDTEVMAASPRHDHAVQGRQSIRCWTSPAPGAGPAR